MLIHPALHQALPPVIHPPINNPANPSPPRPPCQRLCLRAHASALTLALSLALGWPYATQAATPAGGLVFDPTNFAKNTITATETVKQTIEQVKGNVLRLQQLQELVASRKNLSVAALAVLGGAGSVAEVRQRIADVQSLQQALGSLQTNLQTMKTRFDMRLTAAQALGMTLEVYYTAMKQKAKTDAEKIQTGVEADKKALERVNKAHLMVQQWTGAISGINSQVAGLSVLGSQMNMLVAQNAELMSYLVRDKFNQRDEAQKALADTAQTLATDEAVHQAAKKAYDDSRKDLQESLKKNNTASSRAVP